MTAIHHNRDDRPGWALCRHIRNPVTTNDINEVTCLACIKVLKDIPHTVSLVNQTRKITVPLNPRRARPLRA